MCIFYVHTAVFIALHTVESFMRIRVKRATVKLEVQLLHRPPPPLERSGKGGGGRCKLGFGSSGNTK